MTYTYKISKRLAQCYGAMAAATLALGACAADRSTSVLPATVVRVAVTPDSLLIDPGQSVQFRASGHTAAGDSLPVSVTWSASAGTISSSGFYTADTSLNDVTVTALYPSASLTGTARVGKRRVVQVVLTPASAAVAVGGTQAFTAVGVRNSGDTVPVNATFAATGGSIGGNGVYTAGPVAGSYRVIASDSKSGVADTSAVTVTAAPPVPVASVVVSPASASLQMSATVQLSAAVKDSAGNSLTGRTITWTSTDQTVATVSASGLVTGVAAGTATIAATSEGKTGSAGVTVTAPPPAGLCTPTGSGVCRYVDAAAGNDANPGTSSQPYRTLQKAAGVVNPGDVVIVRSGVYTGGSVILDISRSGTAANWITFRAETKWGAVIDGGNNTSATGVEIGGSYIRVEGFEVRGTSHYGIEAYGGSNVQVAQNHVHDVGHYCTSTSNGIVGINAYVSNLLIEQNVVHDVGRYADGENGCSTTNNYWQNHDHGIYNGEGDNVIIRNNVFYSFQRGWAIQRYSGSGIVTSNLQIVNNTFVGANPYKDGQIIIATAVIGLVITNNIFYQPTTAGIWFDATGLTGTVANNLTYGANLSTGSLTGLVLGGNLTADPRFVNAAGYNFHLQSGSPAVDAGQPLSNVPNDVEGVFRPQGVRHDIGAHEYR